MSYLFDITGHFGYAGIFIMLFVCGMGIPIPEDIILLAGGYFVYTGDLKFIPSLIVSIAGVLVGDSTMFFLGRKGGHLVTQVRIFRPVFTPKRLSKAMSYFERYGGKTIFIARFLPGIRSAMYLSAGLFRMNYLKFIALDALAAVISVPLFLYVAIYFGEEIDVAIVFIRKAKYTGLVVGGIVTLAVVVYLLFNRKMQGNGDINLSSKVPLE